MSNNLIVFFLCVFNERGNLI